MIVGGVQDLNPRIHISESDRESLTSNGRMCDWTGQIGTVEFEMIMRDQVNSSYFHACVFFASVIA
jgi:hypothetical protein